MPDSTTPPAPANTPKVQPSIQNKLIANYIVEAQTFLKTASTDPEIRPLLEQHGYDDAEFKIGTDLANAAGSGLDLRQAALGKRDDARDELHLSADEARHVYASFRSVARAAFPAQQDRVGLALVGDVPEDFQRFVTLAHTSYTNAGQPPYAEKATKRGYPADRLKTLLDNLDSFTANKSTKDEAEGGAIASTDARDQACQSLRDYMKELKGVARGVLRGNRAALAKLNL